MACRESRGVKVLLHFGLFLFSASLCHCARLTRQALDKLDGNSLLNQSRAKDHQHHGRLSVGQKLLQGPKPSGTKTVNNIRGAEADYQADMAWGEANQPDGPHDGPDLTAMEKLLKIEPKVECTLDSMMLQIHDAASKPGSLLFVDRGSHLSPLPVSKLPSSCGYTIRSTQRDLVLVAPYDGCFVALEEDSYVLPLLWWGSPMRMSCPLMSPLSLNPPVVTCNTEGMLIKTEWTLPVSNIKVKLNGNWQPLTAVSNRCGFSTVEHPEGVLLSARYTSCLEKKDGLYTLEVAGDEEATISCPSELPAQPEYTENPAKDPEWQSEPPSKGVYPPGFLRDPHHALKPAEVAAPQLPGLPQNSNIPNKGPEDPDRPFYPTLFYPYAANPVNTPAVNPRRASSPVIQTATDKRWQNFFPFYSQPPAPKTVPTQPLTKPPAAQLEEHLLPSQFNPFPSLFQKPVVPHASQPESQEKKLLHQFSFYPQINEAHPAYQKLPEKSGLPEAPQPEAQVQVSQPFYFYPQLKPEVQPATKPSTVPQPEAPPPQLHQQMHLCPGNQLARDPNAALSLGTETFLEEVHKLCQPTTGRNDETDATENQSAQPALRHPQGRMYHLFNQLYYPRQLQPVTFPSTTNMQQQVTAEPSDQKYPDSTIPQTNNEDAIPQGPQLSSAYMQPVCCPQFCPSGLSDCCPQITFYQHLQITPAEPGSKDVPRLYPQLSFLPPAAYFEFVVGSARLSQKPTEAVTAQSATSHTSAPISLQPFPSGSVKQSYLQPADGNPATPQGSNPSWTENREPPLYHSLAPASLHSHWPHLQQNEDLPNLPHSQPQAYYSESSKPLATRNDPVNPMVQYESPMQVNSQLLTGYLNSRSWPDFMSYSQNSQQHQNKPPGKELEDFMVPFYRLQRAPVPTSNNSAVPKDSKPFMSISKNSKHGQLLKSYSEPGNHVLLQHGPPGEPNRFTDSSVLFRDLNIDANFVTQNLERHQNDKGQSLNLKPLQKKYQLSKWLGERIPSPSPGDVSYGDGNDNHDDGNSGLLLLSPALAGSPLMNPRYKSSLGAVHLNPKFHKSFKNVGRSLTPFGSSNRVPSYIPQKMFKAWSSEADH